jgi:UDP-N-acetylmuramoyl-L-alanyl-D-glutamate--2,6-diaminopimelate ligase
MTGRSTLTMRWQRARAAAVGCDAPTTARLAERFWGEPSKALQLIGITGTNGKTTVAYMVRHLLNATGRKCGMLSTVEADVGDSSGGAKPQAAELTTPGACEISRTLARMVANGCTHAVMECSSHALDQGRCDALAFDVAVFTNLSGDHLDYHQTMEAYAAAKAKLFELVGYGCRVANADDAWAARVAGNRDGTIRYGLSEGTDVQLIATIVECTSSESIVDARWLDECARFSLPLVGRHNIYNMLAAIGATAGDFIGLPLLADVVATMKGTPGRLERVTATDAPFTVLVDYAHTDDALRNVLESLRPLVPDGSSLLVLFGCGGDRDKTKRPRMAQVACELADRVVITSDNPRTEDPQQIINDIEAGVPATHRDRVTALVDRREAIEQIIGSAQDGDIVLIAGKGHEDYQIIGSTKHPFDDRQIARAVLALLGHEPMNSPEA